MESVQEAISGKNSVEVVTRATRILYTFLTPPHSFGVTEICNRTGFTKNQVFRLLQTLREVNLVEQDSKTKEYRLGFGVIELSSAAARGSTLIHAADPVLDMLQTETGETVSLFVRADQTSAICIAVRASQRRLQITGQVGARKVFHAGATPRLLLAYSPQEMIDEYLIRCSPLTEFTPRTITDPVKLVESLDQVRQQGFAESNGEIDLELCAVAAPIRNKSGVVVAGVSIGMPATRAGIEELRQHIASVVIGGVKISERLAAIQQIDRSAVPDLYDLASTPMQSRS